jgi:predicted transcriptional regulator
MHAKQMKRALFLFLFLLVGMARVSAEIVCTIRYYDKKVYYPESDIELKVTLTNQSPNPYLFRISENRAFSVSFEVRNLKNQLLPQAQKFTSQRNSNLPVLFRDISLEPEEEYSFRVNLKDFVQISEPGTYTIQALFYPRLYGNPKTETVASNVLTLVVRPSVAGLEAVKEQIDLQVGEFLKQAALPPDEVVKYVLTARQKSEWNKFFLYIDLESLYQRSPEGARRYKYLSEAERIETLKKFRQQLSETVVDEDILMIPSEFEILKTTYTPREAVVEVLQKFAQKGFKEVKRYTYYLYRKNDIWLIYNYETRNLGTE